MYKQYFSLAEAKKMFLVSSPSLPVTFSADLPGEINIKTSTYVHFITLLMETAAGPVFSQLWLVF